MDLKIENYIAAFFQITKFNSKNEIIYEGPEFENTVLDCGLISLLSYSPKQLSTYINLGSSNTPVDITQTGLLDRKFSSNTTFNGQSSYGLNYFNPWYCFFKKVTQFNIGTCTGTFKELGLIRLSNSEYLNRQLFKDGAGNPVSVTVAADEGLRIVVECRVYLDPMMKQYSQVFKIELNGATAGSIVFSNGTTTKSVTLARLKSANDLRPDLCSILGADSLTLIDYSNSSLDTIYIYCHPTNSTSLNLLIASHTLTGGTGAPVLSTVYPYGGHYKESSFILNNETTSEQNIINYKLYATPPKATGLTFPSMKGATTSGSSSFYQWGYRDSGKTIQWYTLTFLAQALKVAINGAAEVSEYTSNVVTKSPGIGDYSITVKSYYAPGKLGTGDKIICGLFHSSASLGSVGAGFQAIFNPMITVSDLQEIEFSATLSISGIS